MKELTPFDTPVVSNLGENIIFLISQPRSGSTLLQRILAGHPDIHTTAEPWIMLHPLYALRRVGHSAEYDSILAKDALDDFCLNLKEGEDVYIRALRQMSLYLYSTAIKESGKTFFLDKTPRYYLIIKDLYRVFPKANFIFLLRNPLAVLSSILDTWVYGHWNSLSQFRSDLLKAPRLIAEGLHTIQGNAIIMQYEELIVNTEKVLRSFCKKLNIDFYPSISEYGNKPAPKGRMGDQVGIIKHKSPVPDYLDKWTKRLSSPHRNYLANIYLNNLGPSLLSKLGYSFEKLMGDLSSISIQGAPLDEEIKHNLLFPLGLSNINNEQILQKNAFTDHQAPFLYKSTTSDLCKVSAIVSTYNSERFMRGCLEDLVNQTLYKKGELEIIVIDSGSEQNEKAIVEEFQKTHENIIYIRTKRETVYAAWNRGIKLSSGKYITNANTDDRHRKDALEIMADKLDQNPGIGLVYADVMKTGTENEIFDRHTPIGAYKWKDYNRELLTLCCFMGPQPMWRKTLHDKYGYFDESFTSSGDWEFWLRIAEDTEMLHIPEFLGLYFYSPQSAEHRDKEKKTREDFQILKKYVAKYLSTEEDIDRGLNFLKRMEPHRGDIFNDDVLTKSLAKLKQYMKIPKPAEHLPTDISVSREAFGEPASLEKEIPEPAEVPDTSLQKTRQTDLVSIILLVHRDLDLTRRCLRSIRKHTPEPHEILFAPVDPSFDPPKWMRKLIKERDNYRLITPIRNSLQSKKPVIPAGPESFLRHTPLSPLDRGESERFPTSGNDNLMNKGGFHDHGITFSEACNAGFAESSGEYILIVNDGVIVTEGWLSGMLECLRRTEDAGIVGPMMTNVDGPQGIELLDSRGQGVKGSKEKGSRIQGFKGSSDEKNTVIARREATRQTLPEQRDRHAPLAMTDSENVIARSEATKQSLSKSEKNEIAALLTVARNDCNTNPSTPRILESLNPEVIQKYAKEFRERNKHRRAIAGKLHHACILFRHSLADAIGLFDNRFRSPEFSVEDYSLRASISGLNNFIAGDVLVSNSKDQPAVEKKRELFREKRRFVSKWSVVDSEGIDAQKLHASNALMASYEMRDRGDANKALSILLDGLGSNPDDKRLHHAVVELLIRQRRFREALDVLGAMPDSFKHTIRWLELKCVCKDGLNEYDDAYACVERLLAMNRESPVALNLKGMKAFRQANRSEAESYFKQAIGSHPGFGEAYANLGAVQWSAQNHESAFAVMEKAFILAPTSEDIAINYHAASVALSRVDRATFIFREAASLHPLHKKLKYMLADLLLQQEQYQVAMDVIEEALLAFGIDDDSLTLAAALREKIGAIEIKQGSRGQGVKGSSEEKNTVIARSPEGTTRQSLPEQRDRHAPLAMTDSENVIAGGHAPSVIARSEATTQSLRKSEKDEIAALPPVARNDRKTNSTPRILESSNPTLSICMIVKNEEKNIGKCLRSIKKLAEEMIVVDTGSTDRTKEIAKVFGAKVYDFEWTNSFSDARNYSISKASGDWILILDADETIAPEDFGKIRELIKKWSSIQGAKDSSGEIQGSSEEKNTVIARSEATRQSPAEQRDRHAPLAMTDMSPVARNDRKTNSTHGTLEPLDPAVLAYSLVSRNYVVSMNTTGWIGNDGTYLEQEAGTGWTPSKKVRLFPNDPRIRFEEPVHELVENSLNAAGIPIEKCDVPVHHYGKLNMSKVTEKGQQYYELGKAKFRSESDLLAIYELALQASELGRYEDALVQWNRFIALMPDYPKAFYGLGYAHYSLKQYEEAFKAFSQSASLAQDEVEWRDAVTLLAHAAIGAGKPGDCIDYLGQLLRKDTEYPMALLLLSVAHACAGDIEKGNVYLDMLEKSNFDGTPYLAYFAEVHLSEQRVAPAVALLNMARKLGRMPTRIAELIAECERRMGETKEGSRVEESRGGIQGSRIQGFKGSSEEKNTVIARSPEGTTRQSPAERQDRHAPLAMTDSENVIARSEATKQSLRKSKKDEIAALPKVARNDRKTSSTHRTLELLNPTLSLCMIVKNEENNIRRALDSIKPVVDEMIVVDTGSSDNTKDIARDLGAKVYDFAWTDSFADARNFAISKATSDWILILDADEVISPSDHEELRKMINKGSRIQGIEDSSGKASTVIARSEATRQSLPEQQDRHAPLAMTDKTPVASNDFNNHSAPRTLESSDPSPIAYLFTTRNYVHPTNVAGWVSNDGKYPAEEAGTGWFPGEKVRLFPNDKGIRFENPVHERIETSLEKMGISIKQSIIPIHHYGMLDEVKIRAKNEYYYDLGKKRVADKGRQDFRAVYDLAVQASGIGRFNEALEYFQKAIAMNPGFAKAHESLGNTYYNLKQYRQALTSYVKAVELDPSSRDAVLMSAQCEIILGESGQASDRLETLLKKDPANEKALFLAASACFANGLREKGMDYANKLKEMQSGLITHFRDFAHHLFMQNKNIEAQRLLDASEEIKNQLG